MSNSDNETTAATPPSLHPNLVVSPSKAHRILFTKLRNLDTSCGDFVKYAKRSMRILVEDALAEFPTNPLSITTPCGPHKGLDSIVVTEPTRLCAVSIVRSGDCLLDQVREVEPSCTVGKILIQRDETSPNKEARLLYTKMPPLHKLDYVILCDPMLATGGSAKTALNVLCKEPYRIPPSKIIFCNMICAPEGLQAMAKAYPDVKIVTACIDECLNAEKFIVPGLGDFGDRYFNTVE